MRKRRAKQKTEMSEHEKNMVATRQFMNRLPNKKYFSRFRYKNIDNIWCKIYFSPETG